MIRKTLLSALGAGTLLLGALAAGAPAADATPPGLHAKRVCSASTRPPSRAASRRSSSTARASCRTAPPRTPALRPPRTSTTPTSSPARAGRPHRRHRGRLRLPEPRAGPRVYRSLLRAPRLHHGERLLHGSGPERRHQPAAVRRRVGARAGPRRGRGVGGSARTARSSSSRPPRPRSPTSVHAVNTAAQQPVSSAISNSYGGGDLPTRPTAATTTTPASRSPPRAVTAATTAAASRPSSAYVTAVGGTSLVTGAPAPPRLDRDRVERCRFGLLALNAALAAAAGSQHRLRQAAIADVSAAADPSNGGLAVYDPTTDRLDLGAGRRHQRVVADHRGGLRAVRQHHRLRQRHPVRHPPGLFDVTSGSNGTCPTSQSCTARVGWDGPTGLGTPNGTGAF